MLDAAGAQSPRIAVNHLQDGDVGRSFDVEGVLAVLLLHAGLDSAPGSAFDHQRLSDMAGEHLLSRGTVVCVERRKTENTHQLAVKLTFPWKRKDVFGHSFIPSTNFLS